MVDAAASLGFKLKHRQFAEPDQGTFLKGWWCSCSDSRYRWLPLPSAVLKMAKILRHPRDIFPDMDDEAAYRSVLYALSSSPGYVPADYPILGPFIQKMKSLGTYTDVDISHKKYRIVVPPFEARLDRDRMIEKIYTRYEITQEDIESFERMISQIDSLPVLLDSPVFGKLMADYM